MSKIYTIQKTRTQSMSTSEFFGTVEDLVKMFQNTLNNGNGYNPKINTNPKTIKSLLSNLAKSVQELQGSCYYPDCYELIKNV